MTYKLPEPVRMSSDQAYLGYTAEQMQQAYAAGREAATIPLIDRLVVLHIYRKEHDTDPALALKDILDWEIQAALDPQVCSDAQALVQRGRDSMKAECVKVCEVIAENTYFLEIGNLKGRSLHCAHKLKELK